jgi:hypothetical protein
MSHSSASSWQICALSLAALLSGCTSRKPQSAASPLATVCADGTVGCAGGGASYTKSIRAYTRIWDKWGHTPDGQHLANSKYSTCDRTDTINQVGCWKDRRRLWHGAQGAIRVRVRCDQSADGVWHASFDADNGRPAIFRETPKKLDGDNHETWHNHWATCTWMEETVKGQTYNSAFYCHAAAVSSWEPAQTADDNLTRSLDFGMGDNISHDNNTGSDYQLGLGGGFILNVFFNQNLVGGNVNSAGTMRMTFSCDGTTVKVKGKRKDSDGGAGAILTDLKTMPWVGKINGPYYNKPPAQKGVTPSAGDALVTPSPGGEDMAAGGSPSSGASTGYEGDMEAWAEDYVGDVMYDPDGASAGTPPIWDEGCVDDC